MTAREQELYVFNKQSKDGIFLAAARDHITQVGTKLVKVEKRAEEAYKLIKDIDNILKKSNK